MLFLLTANIPRAVSCDSCRHGGDAAAHAKRLAAASRLLSCVAPRAHPELDALLRIDPAPPIALPSAADATLFVRVRADASMQLARAFVRTSSASNASTADVADRPVCWSGLLDVTPVWPDVSQPTAQRALTGALGAPHSGQTDHSARRRGGRQASDQRRGPKTAAVWPRRPEARRANQGDLGERLRVFARAHRRSGAKLSQRHVQVR